MAVELANYFILPPLFEGFMPLDALIAFFAAFIPFIRTKLDVVPWNAVPFNLLRVLGVSLATMPVHPKLTPHPARPRPLTPPHRKEEPL